MRASSSPASNKPWFREGTKGGLGYVSWRFLFPRSRAWLIASRPVCYPTDSIIRPNTVSPPAPATHAFIKRTTSSPPPSEQKHHRLKHRRPLSLLYLILFSSLPLVLWVTGHDYYQFIGAMHILPLDAHSRETWLHISWNLLPISWGIRVLLLV